METLTVIWKYLLNWRGVAPDIVSIASIWFALLAAGRVYTASGQPPDADTTKLNRAAAKFGAVSVSFQSIAYFLEKILSP